jgi:hypothetical protein
MADYKIVRVSNYEAQNHPSGIPARMVVLEWRDGNTKVYQYSSHVQDVNGALFWGYYYLCFEPDDEVTELAAYDRAVEHWQARMKNYHLREVPV